MYVYNKNKIRSEIYVNNFDNEKVNVFLFDK